MATATTDFTRVNFQWIKADSGDTYLRPVDELSKLDNPTEAEPRAVCVDESDNPQND